MKLSNPQHYLRHFRYGGDYKPKTLKDRLYLAALILTGPIRAWERNRIETYMRAVSLGFLKQQAKAEPLSQEWLIANKAGNSAHFACMDIGEEWHHDLTLEGKLDAAQIYTETVTLTAKMMRGAS
jgi:hypothetical protein